MTLTPEIIRERLSSRKFDPEKEIGPENKIFTIQSQTIGCSNSLVTFSGLPKSGKSTFLAGLIASRILHFECLGMELNCPKDRPKLAYFDTESSAHDFHRQVQRIKRFADAETLPDYLSLFCTREDSPGWQIQMINQYITDTPDCSVVIVDGLLDLIINYNDETESRKLIQWIKTLTAKHDILFITVLHTSKSGEQRLGHLGAGVDRYSQSVLDIVKENGNYILKPKYLRSAPGFDDITIQYDNSTGIYHQIEASGPAPDFNADVLKLFEYNRRYSTDEMIKMIKAHTGRGDNHAKGMIKQLKESKQIDKDRNGKYFLLVQF